jgi:DNA (cytosine-5)-methyltransferase 1
MVIAVDLFAGAGGFTTGAEAAGCRVAWAANHWPAAVEAHSRNHPATAHACQDLHQADWSQVPAHDLLLASPACQGHSRARGKDAPRHDASRSTAWAVVSALEAHRAPVAVVENVPDFARWVLFPAWRAAVDALGYSVAPHIIDAADLGVPQHRSRLYLVLTRSRAPMVLRLPRMAHVPASSVVDFDAGRWSPVVRPGRSAATLARVAAGRAVHGDRCLVSYYGTSRGGRSLARPVGTLTTRARYAVVDGDRMRMLTVPEQRAAMGFPADYWLPPSVATATHLLGNAVCPPVAEVIIRAIGAQP